MMIRDDKEDTFGFIGCAEHAILDKEINTNYVNYRHVYKYLGTEQQINK